MFHIALRSGLYEIKKNILFHFHSVIIKDGIKMYN